MEQKQQSFTSLGEALEVLREVYNPESMTFDLKVYKAACEYVADHRSELKERVYLRTPRTMNGDWDKVKAVSIPRCGCGIDWVIPPNVTRTQFEEGAGGDLVLTEAMVVSFKPVGSHNSSAYVAFLVMDGELAMFNEPLAPNTHNPTADIMNGMMHDKSYLLADVDKALSNPGVPLLFTSSQENGAPICVIKAVDLLNNTVTVILDKDIEVVRPELNESVPNANKN